MTPMNDIRILKRRFRALEKRRRFLKRMEQKRRVHVGTLRLRQRLRLDILQYKLHKLERRKAKQAKRETAKLNRTLKRRRKK